MVGAKFALSEAYLPIGHPVGALSANLSGVILGSIIVIIGFLRDNRLEQARQRTEEERQRADTAEARAERERERADHYLAELQHFRELNSNCHQGHRETP